MAAKRGLGRGLGALINDGIRGTARDAEQAGIRRIPVADISSNRLQPRHKFDPDALVELAASIRERGVLQPLLVREVEPNRYQLIAGERRLRAATEAELTEVPVIVMEATDHDALELALIENLQREDLNVLEEAEGYHILAETYDLTQEQIADRVGKARTTVANTLRLLSLPEDVRRLIAEDKLSAGHAKIMSGMDDPEEQSIYAGRCAKESLSVRNLEKLIEKDKRVPRKARASRNDMPGSHLAYLSDKLHAHFGTSVRLTSCRTYANGKKGKGTVEIDFYSNEDLTRILDILGIEAE